MKQQNTKNLSDRAFAHLIVTSLLGILVCVICLSATTYAWFTGSVHGNNNKIKAADTCLLSVSVHKNGTEAITATVADENGKVLEKAQGEYTVTLALPKESASGYLVLTADGQEYYSDYLQRNDTSDQTLTFTINVETEQDVTFTAHWGIYTGTCHVKNSEELNIK